MNHSHDHAFSNFNGRTREGLSVIDRRGMLKASVAGMAGLSLPSLLRAREEATQTGANVSKNKAVILLWMAGGPSHIDTWDPKPDRPFENRGPFGVINTKLPGVQICEHLPKQAAMLDKFSIIRSVDPRKSSHQPNRVFQTGNLEAAPRVNPKGDKYPAIASIVAKHYGANQQGMPPYVAFQTHNSHIGYAGYLGKEYDPFIAQRAAKLPVYTNVGVDTGRMAGADVFKLHPDLTHDRVNERRSLLRQIDQLRRGLDNSGAWDAMDTYEQMAVDMVAGSRAQKAFDISKEPASVRERYGNHLWQQETMMARRLVEHGVSFVTLDLSYHTASGTWDNHGIPGGVYGGISKGLGPLLPLFDGMITTLVSDLEERGMLDDVLVIAMGEFGRTPNIGTQKSVDGRNHWPVVMSMCMAGGGFRHGQVIGASESDGGHIKERPVRPGDLAATIYHHFGIPQDTTYLNDRQRPIYAVQQNGKPIRELLS